MSDEAPKAERAVLAPDPDDTPRVLLHMPVDVRSLSLIVLTVLASIYALHWAKAILVPILLGVMFSYALTPLVDTLQRWRVPRAIGAAAVLSTIVLVIGWGTWKLSDDATALIENLPEVAHKLRQAVEKKPGQATASPIEKVQQAANELEQAATQAASEASAAAAASAAASRPGPRRSGTTTTTTIAVSTMPAPNARGTCQRCNESTTGVSA
jgi:predicted PurR-regulated permease PerM